MALPTAEDVDAGSDMAISADAELDNLIGAMAGFAPEASNSSTLTPPTATHHQWVVAASI